MKRILRYLHLHRQEQQRRALLFVVGFFLGVFATAYTAAESVFLTKLRINKNQLYERLADNVKLADKAFDFIIR